MSNLKALYSLLSELETIQPFDDPERQYTLNPAFARGKCNEYSEMLKYVLVKSGFDAVSLYETPLPNPHESVLVKIENQMILIDWTQSQFFGQSHFWGTYGDLLAKIKKEKCLSHDETAKEEIKKIYGIASMEDLKAGFEKEKDEIKIIQRQKNLFATREDILLQSSAHSESVIDFNRDVLSRISYPQKDSQRVWVSIVAAAPPQEIVRKKVKQASSSAGHSPPRD